MSRLHNQGYIKEFKVTHMQVSLKIFIQCGRDVDAVCQTFLYLTFAPFVIQLHPPFLSSTVKFALQYELFALVYAENSLDARMMHFAFHNN